MLTLSNYIGRDSPVSGVAPDRSVTGIEPRFLAPAEVSVISVLLHTSDTTIIYVVICNILYQLCPVSALLHDAKQSVRTATCS